jgi:O-antigen/teichoic acid export membrane protein
MTSGALVDEPANRQPEMPYEPPSVARGGVEALGFRLIELFGQVAIVIVTARLMEPAGRGLYALASLVAVLCSLPLGPVWSANAIEVARQRTPLPELLGAATRIAAWGGIATSLVAFALAPLAGDRWWVIVFPAAAAPFILLARYAEGLYQAFGHVRAVNLMTVARVALPLALITPPLALGADAQSAILVWTAWLVLLPALAYPPLRSMVGGSRRPREAHLYRRLISTGSRLSVAGAALLLSPRIALIALAAFSGDSAVGVYSVAVAAADALYLTANSLVSTTFRGISNRDRAASVELSARALRHAFVLATAAGVLLIPAVHLLLPHVVGAGYEEVSGLLIVLLPGVLGLSGFAVLHTFFTVQLGQPRIVTRIAVITLSVSAVACLALVPLAGLWGAAIAATLSNITSAALCLRRFRAETGVPLRLILPGRGEVRDYVALLRSLASSRRAARGA